MVFKLRRVHCFMLSVEHNCCRGKKERKVEGTGQDEGKQRDKRAGRNTLAGEAVYFKQMLTYEVFAKARGMNVYIELKNGLGLLGILTSVDNMLNVKMISVRITDGHTERIAPTAMIKGRSIMFARFPPNLFTRQTVAPKRQRGAMSTDS